MNYHQTKMKNRPPSSTEQAEMAILLPGLKKVRELVAGNHVTLPQRPMETFSPLIPCQGKELI